jgi:hypothetical protein
MQLRTKRQSANRSGLAKANWTDCEDRDVEVSVMAAVPAPGSPFNRLKKRVHWRLTPVDAYFA